jgi:hypothetical protein
MGQSMSFDFALGDQVRLKDAPHIGGRVSGLCVRGGAQVVEVHHYNSEGEMGVREFPSTDLEAASPQAAPEKPKATPGAPPSAIVAPTTSAPSTAATGVSKS